MKRVIDSSVAFKWVVPETSSGKALVLRDDFRNGSVELLAPDAFPIEVGRQRSYSCVVTRAAKRWSREDCWSP